MIALLVSLFFVGAEAGFAFTVDLNCTTPDKAFYTPSAVGCNNVQADSACSVTYPPDPVDGPITAGGQQDRPPKCYAANGMFNGPLGQDVKNMALATCPKSCGLCCQTPAYSCTNAPFPRINCATVTSTMCQSAQWRTVLAQDCPNTCGFCLLGGCIDAAPDCATQPTICQTIGLESFVAANCQRTCNLCTASTTTATSSTTTATSSLTLTCADINSNCANWKNNGFCTSLFYTSAQKIHYCGKTCALC